MNISLVSQWNKQLFVQFVLVYTLIRDHTTHMKKLIPWVDVSTLWTKSRNKSLIKNDFALSCILCWINSMKNYPIYFAETYKFRNYNEEAMWTLIYFVDVKIICTIARIRLTLVGDSKRLPRINWIERLICENRFINAFFQWTSTIKWQKVPFLRLSLSLHPISVHLGFTCRYDMCYLHVCVYVKLYIETEKPQFQMRCSSIILNHFA